MSIYSKLIGLSIIFCIACSQDTSDNTVQPEIPETKDIFQNMDDNCQVQDVCIIIDSNAQTYNIWIPYKIVNNSNQSIFYLTCPPRFENTMVCSNDVRIPDSLKANNCGAICFNGFSRSLDPGDTTEDIYKEGFTDTGNYCLEFAYGVSNGNAVKVYSDTFRVGF